MQEIKFRAWYTQYRRMAYCDKDVPEDVDYWDGVECSIISMVNGQLSRSNDKERAVIFMQFTGLKDKAGVDIYEDDVLPHDDGNTKVVWKVDGWVCEFAGGDVVPLSELTTFFGNQATVIGNIHNNPDLCK